MSAINETAARGFARAADAYERSRPAYPPEALDWLAGEATIDSGATVVDLAAGTGRLTRALADRGASLVAIEPVAEMRAILERAVPGADARDATAEHTGLSDASADTVTVAQAFHWFDGPAALAEIDRILRPGGHLALLWNVRDLDDPTQRAGEDLLAPHRRETPAHRRELWRAAFDETGRFRRSAIRHFPNVPTIDADSFAERIASTSFIADLPSAERDRILERARDIAAGLPPTFPFPYVTEVEVFTRPSTGHS